MWSHDKLKKQVECLFANPSVGIVQGLIQQVRFIPTKEGNKYENYAEPYQFINLGSAIYKKSVFDKIGYLDETLNYGEDNDLFLRAWENEIQKFFLNDVTLFYRKHQENMTNGKQDLVELGYVRVFKRHLDRCRKSGKFTAITPTNIPKLADYFGNPPQQTN